MGSGEGSTMRNFIVSTVHLIKSRRLRWAGHVARKGPLGKRRIRWKDNIRMNIKGIGINTRNWVDSAQYRDFGEPL